MEGRMNITIQITSVHHKISTPDKWAPHLNIARETHYSDRRISPKCFFALNRCTGDNHQLKNRSLSLSNLIPKVVG